MDRPEYIPARMESWRYASAYPRIPYRKPELETVLHVNYWPLSPLRGWLAEQLRQDEHQYFGGNDMNESMKLKDLRSGYVVELRNGTKWLVARAGNDFTRILVDNNGSWGYLDHCYNEDLTMKDSVEGVCGGVQTQDIMKVYGLVSNPRHWQNAACTTLGLSYRPLLWRRIEAKKLTVDQISELLGYPVEIVGENR